MKNSSQSPSSSSGPSGSRSGSTATSPAIQRLAQQAASSSAASSFSSSSASLATSSSASAGATTDLPAAATVADSLPPSASTQEASSTRAGAKVLPYLFDDAPLDDVLVLVADMLTRLTQHNDSLPLHPSSLTRFHSRAAPNISLPAYLRRIAKYTSVEKCCMLILLVYIDRVCERMQGFTICGLTVHRFVCAAVLCASKALCDAFNTNEHYSRVGGITLGEMNLLEKEFLNIIDWRLTCSGSLLQHYYTSLVRSHADYVLADPPPEETPKSATTAMEIEPATEQRLRTTGLRGGSSSAASSPRLPSSPLVRSCSQHTLDGGPGKRIKSSPRSFPCTTELRN